MPGMDGVECFHAVKAQVGGLCKETPVVALTANAGSDIQALYKREGFDEYLVKPVDAMELEHTVRMLLPADLVKKAQDAPEIYESASIVREIKKKIPILITTESVADIPQELREKLNIPVIPYIVMLNEGIFYDTTETGVDAVVRCLQDEEVIAESCAPSVSEYEKFFSEQLTIAQHIIHISMGRHVSEGYANACEAALSFYNVKVVDSGQISSGMGLLALYAKEMAESGQYDPEAIAAELDIKKEKIKTSFVINDTEYLYKCGHLSSRMHKLCEAFMLHPMMETYRSSVRVSDLWMGGFEKARKRYIRKMLRNAESIDKSKLFIIYAGTKNSEIDKIRVDIEKMVPFETVYMQKASPSVSVNCGPGMFGLLYARK
jgi:DegV family protein with EDD domain